MTDEKKTVASGNDWCKWVGKAVHDDMHASCAKVEARQGEGEGIGPDTHARTLPGRDHHPTTPNPRSTPDATPNNDATHDGTRT